MLRDKQKFGKILRFENRGEKDMQPQISKKK